MRLLPLVELAQVYLSCLRDLLLIKNAIEESLHGTITLARDSE